jgi:hypothetical protein
VAPIVVEPETLAGAGVSISAVGDELATALNTLAADLPNGAMAGHDRAGLAFGQAYRQAGQALMNAGAAAVSGGRKVGFGVQMSATNYSRADASSTIGGGASALTPPTAPGEFDAPSVPSPFGGGVAEPFLWSMVEMLVGDVWPNGDPEQLRAAASAWSSFASTLSGIGTQLEGSSATISGQQIPEGGEMATALSDLKQGLSDITTESVRLATQTFEFAADVEAAQNAIRDLLSRLSPSGIFDGLGAIFSGDAMEELREIADDIRTVLDNLKRQADARQQSMQDVMQMIDDAVVSLEQKARKEFTHYLGDDVGNAAATVFDTSLNMREGIIKGGIGALEDLQQLNPLRFAYDFEGAKDTWGGMLETNFNASVVGQIIDPERATQTQKEILKGLVHAEDWTTERPGLGLGENIFDVGSAFVGGAGVARTGTRAAGEAADAAEGAAPGVRAAGAYRRRQGRGFRTHKRPIHQAHRRPMYLTRRQSIDRRPRPIHQRPQALPRMLPRVRAMHHGQARRRSARCPNHACRQRSTRRRLRIRPRRRHPRVPRQPALNHQSLAIHRQLRPTKHLSQVLLSRLLSHRARSVTVHRIRHLLSSRPTRRANMTVDIRVLQASPRIPATKTIQPHRRALMAK